MLGNIASVATLILFVIYFVGRTITIFRTKNLYKDEVAIFKNNKYLMDEYNIVESFCVEDNPYNSFILTSREGIYSISLYRLKFDNSMNVIGREKVDEYKFLNVGQSLEVCLTIPELITTYELEYYTPDYKKVTIELWENLKNGVVSESATVKHTWKSFLYYLFR